MAAGQRVRKLVTAGFFLTLVFFAGCKKPMLRSDRSGELPEEKPEEIGSKAPTDPFQDSPAPEPIGEMLVVDPPKNPVEPSPPISSKQQAEQVARLAKMLEAQLAGIRSLESDLARHSQPLYELRTKLQAARMRQSGQRSGGIRVERVNGKSIFVDHAGEARKLEGQIKEQERVIEPFRKSLEMARKKYEELQQRMAVLRGG